MNPPQEIKDFTSSKLYKDYATWYGFNKDYYNLKPSDIQNITKIVAHETIKAHEGIHLAAKKHGFFPYGEKTVTSTGGMNLGGHLELPELRIKIKIDRDS